MVDPRSVSNLFTHVRAFASLGPLVSPMNPTPISWRKEKFRARGIAIARVSRRRGILRVADHATEPDAFQRIVWASIQFPADTLPQQCRFVVCWGGQTSDTTHSTAVASGGRVQVCWKPLPPGPLCRPPSLY